MTARYPLVLNGSSLEELQPADQLPASIVAGLSAVATTGSYSDLTGQPTRVSDFSNDVGFLTNAEAQLLALSVAPVQSVQGRTGQVVVTKADVGLDSVPNVDTLSPISLHRNRITQSLEIPDGFNAVSFGPVEIAAGVTVRGLGNSTWVGV